MNSRKFMKKRTSLMKVWHSFSMVMVFTMVVPVQLFIAAPAYATPPEEHKVDICHYDADTGEYETISVDADAWDEHTSGHSGHPNDFLKEGESCVPLEEAGPICGDNELTEGEECDGELGAEGGYICDETCHLVPGFCPDLNYDGVVNSSDVDIISNAWNQEDCPPYHCDFDQSGTVEIAEVQYIAGRIDTNASDYPELCEIYCGNGVLEAVINDSPAEQCDDSNNQGGDGCSATCQLEDDLLCEEINQEATGWYGRYFNYLCDHPDMQLPDNQWPDLGHGDPLSVDTAWDTDWYDEDYFKFARIDSSITFGEDFFPFDFAAEEITSGHEYHFGVHWRGLVTVPGAGDYDYTMTSDDDAWLYVDGVLVDDSLAGIHAPTTSNGSGALTNQHVVDIFFTERHTTRSH